MYPTNGSSQEKVLSLRYHGRPVFLAVPFSEEIVELGLKPALAIKLYQEGVLTLEKAARFAGISIETLIERLGSLGIPVVSYSPEDLNQELKQR